MIIYINFFVCNDFSLFHLPQQHIPSRQWYVLNPCHPLIPNADETVQAGRCRLSKDRLSELSIE
jgi:hypothetical protein